MNTPIYLDYAASTPIDPRVAASMHQCLTNVELQGNPSSLSHRYGRAARGVIEKARQQVAGALNAKPVEVIWTSGATESNNLALFGVAHYHADRGKHIISSKTEHKAVLEPLKRLEKQGYRVTYLKPDEFGIVHPQQVQEAITPATILVSLMHVNNEIGVIQNIGEVGSLCSERQVLFHVDAAQSAGRLPIDVKQMNVDLLSCTAHKLYGPKGIGALYVRRDPVVGLEPLIVGGGHELGLRAGTLATHQIVGFGLAMELMTKQRDADQARLTILRDQLCNGLQGIADIKRNGHATQCVPNILNVAFDGVEGESLLFALQDLILSAGAACSSGSDEASYVLRALGRSDQQAQSSLRFSLGRFTTEQDINVAVAAVSREVTRLRSISASLL